MAGFCHYMRQNEAIMRLGSSVVAGFIIGAFTLGGCQKYKDGPQLSLIPRNERVANTWNIYHAEQRDTNITGNFNYYDLYLTADGNAELDAKYQLDGNNYTVDTHGTWEFTNEQEHIRFDFENNSQDGEYRILKLTETQMWLSKIGEDVEMHLGEK